MASSTASEPPLIVTLRLDEHSTAIFEGLRRRHFPPHLNRIGAHLTLFHQLPARWLPTVLADLRELAPEPFDVTVTRPVLLGRGVAIEAQSAKLDAVRHQLAIRWSHWLTPQDRQPFRSHITVQNKVDPAVARQLHATLAQTQDWPTVLATGWSVWRYLGGPWLSEAEIPFSPSDSAESPASGGTFG